MSIDAAEDVTPFVKAEPPLCVPLDVSGMDIENRSYQHWTLFSDVS